MSWTEFEKGIEKGPGSAIKTIALWTIVIIAVGFGISAMFRPAEIIGKVMDPDKVLYNYEYFYNQSHAYKAINAKIVTANKSVVNFKSDAGPRESWTFEDKTELSRLRSIADGLVYQCNDIVADYNAKSQQVTRSMFKTDSTPYRLSECN